MYEIIESAVVREMQRAQQRAGDLVGLCLVFGVWCLVFGVWCLVFGVWCLVLIVFRHTYLDS